MTELPPASVVAAARDDIAGEIMEIQMGPSHPASHGTIKFNLRLDGETISEASIAFGAVGPTVIRASKTEAFLRGRPLDEDTMQQAGDIAIAEISPISDVRGAANYRFQLTRNILLKFYHETQSVPV